MTLNCLKKTKEIGDKQKLQYDIDKLVKWSDKWQMLSNFGKCKCLHTGSGVASQSGPIDNISYLGPPRSLACRKS